jgi:hypothetical protein
MTKYIDRIIRVVKLDAEVYKQLAGDKSTTLQGLTVVVLSSMAGGFGFIFRFGPGGIFIGFLMTLLGWLAWFLCILLIGGKVLAEPLTSGVPGPVLRTTGFASAPGLFRVLGIIPLLSNFINLLVSFWLLVTMTMAARYALGYQSRVRALMVGSIGWIAHLLVYLVFFIIFS